MNRPSGSILWRHFLKRGRRRPNRIETAIPATAAAATAAASGHQVEEEFVERRPLRLHGAARSS
jgi:hypothetical protein